MKITFLVGKFESGDKQQWCLAIRDGRQTAREEIILVDPGPEAMEWMKERIRVALKWKNDQNAIWHVLRVPDKIWDHEQDDSGIWICLVATRVASLLGKQPSLSIQERTLKLTDKKDVIIQRGRDGIAKSIEHGMIKEPQGRPFQNLWFERSNRQDKGKDR